MFTILLLAKKQKPVAECFNRLLITKMWRYFTEQHFLPC